MSDSLSFVAAEIVDDDDITTLEGRDQDLLDIGEETLAVDRPVDDTGRGDAIAAERGEEGQRTPPALWHLGDEPLAPRCPAAQARHVGLGPEPAPAKAGVSSMKTSRAGSSRP